MVYTCNDKLPKSCATRHRCNSRMLNASLKTIVGVVSSRAETSTSLTHMQVCTAIITWHNHSSRTRLFFEILTYSVRVRVRYLNTAYIAHIGLGLKTLDVGVHCLRYWENRRGAPSPPGEREREFTPFQPHRADAGATRKAGRRESFPSLKFYRSVCFCVCQNPIRNTLAVRNAHQIPVPSGTRSVRNVRYGTRTYATTMGTIIASA